MRSDSATASVPHDAAAPVDAAGMIHAPAAPARRLDRRYVTAALMLVMVLASMEMTIISTAMPTIIGDLHGLEHYAWVGSIYLLASTVSMPLYGRLADAWGRKRVILGAIALFLVGSALAGYARSMTELIIYRGLQGLGAGGIMPVVLTILGDIFTLQERAKIQGAFSAVWGTAALAGPALGAFIVHHFGWRWVFLVNFPLGLPGLLVLIWKYHDVEKPHSKELDFPGAAALAVACTALLVLVSRLGPGGWSPAVAVTLAMAFAVATFLFIRHERRTAHPIMPPEMLTHRMIMPSLLGSLLLGIGFLSLDTYVPLYVQGGRGGDEKAAASVVTPVMLTWALSSMVAAPLLVRWGFRKTALLGSALICAGFTGLVLCAVFDAPRPVLIGTLALTGMGFGPSSMSYLLAAQDAVTWQQRGVVTGSVTFYRSIGGAVGIGALGALFNGMIRGDVARLAARGVTPAALLDPKVHAQLPPDVYRAVGRTISGGLLWVFVAMLGCAVLQVLVTLLLPARKCDHAVGRTQGMEAMAG